jgi:hypothetical protein
LRKIVFSLLNKQGNAEELNEVMGVSQAGRVYSRTIDCTTIELHKNHDHDVNTTPPPTHACTIAHPKTHVCVQGLLVGKRKKRPFVIENEKLLPYFFFFGGGAFRDRKVYF